MERAQIEKARLVERVQVMEEQLLKNKESKSRLAEEQEVARTKMAGEHMAAKTKMEGLQEELEAELEAMRGHIDAQDRTIVGLNAELVEADGKLRFAEHKSSEQRNTYKTSLKEDIRRNTEDTRRKKEALRVNRAQNPESVSPSNGSSVRSSPGSESKSPAQRYKDQKHARAGETGSAPYSPLSPFNPNSFPEARSKARDFSSRAPEGLIAGLAEFRMTRDGQPILYEAFSEVFAHVTAKGGYVLNDAPASKWVGWVTLPLQRALHLGSRQIPDSGHWEAEETARFIFARNDYALPLKVLEMQRANRNTE